MLSRQISCRKSDGNFINYKSLFYINFNLFLTTICFSIVFSFQYSAPAIRVVDEQGNEIGDRYYKIGSTIDLTCQISTIFIENNGSSNSPEPNILFHNSHRFSTMLPFLNAFQRENEIIEPEKPIRSSVLSSDSRFRRITWKKDGANVTKDAHFNYRYVLLLHSFALANINDN